MACAAVWLPPFRGVFFLTCLLQTHAIWLSENPGSDDQELQVHHPKVEHKVSNRNDQDIESQHLKEARQFDAVIGSKEQKHDHQKVQVIGGSSHFVNVNKVRKTKARSKGKINIEGHQKREDEKRKNLEEVLSDSRNASADKSGNGSGWDFVDVPGGAADANATWESRANESVHGYMDAAGWLFGVLDDLELEWFPADANLLGALRYGSNFGMLSAGLHAVDQDIDVLVRVDSPDDWLVVSKNIQERLLNATLYPGAMFDGCSDNSGIFKFTCGVSSEWKEAHKINGCFGGLHADVHGYVVNDSSDAVVVSPQCVEGSNESEGYEFNCTEGWPFQRWGLSAPYHTVLVNEDGQFRKGVFGQREVNIPQQFTELALKWNDNEYGSNVEELTLPHPGGCMLKKNEDTWTDSFNVSQADNNFICRKTQALEKAGYASLPRLSKEIAPDC